MTVSLRIPGRYKVDQSSGQQFSIRKHQFRDAPAAAPRSVWLRVHGASKQRVACSTKAVYGYATRVRTTVALHCDGEPAGVVSTVEHGVALEIVTPGGTWRRVAAAEQRLAPTPTDSQVQPAIDDGNVDMSGVWGSSPDAPGFRCKKTRTSFFHARAVSRVCSFLFIIIIMLLFHCFRVLFSC